MGLDDLVSEANDSFCVHMDAIIDGQAYFFIQKVDGDWENPPNLAFTSGETAYLSVILSLYVIGVIISTFLLIRHILVNFRIDRMLFIIIVMEAFFICRTVLFSLVLGDTETIQKDPASGYLLIEFPILLFFCFVSFFVIAWGLVLWSNKDVSLSKKKFIWLLNLLAILFNTVIFGLFILMIILFQTVVQPPYYICADTQVIFDSDSAYALSLSYRVIFSTIAFVLGFALLIIGALMARLTTEKQLEIPVRTIVQVAVATLVGTFGLIAQAVYYLVIVIIRGRQSIYLTLSILLVDEIIPALIFTTLAFVTNPGAKGIRGFITKYTTSTESDGKSTTKTKSSNKTKDQPTPYTTQAQTD